MLCRNCINCVLRYFMLKLNVVSNLKLKNYYTSIIILQCKTVIILSVFIIIKIYFIYFILGTRRISKHNYTRSFNVSNLRFFPLESLAQGFCGFR
jgi:hypothetical protein